MGSSSHHSTLRDVCKHFDVSESAVRKWLREGVPCQKGPKKNSPLMFSLDEVSAWIKATGRNLRNGGDRRSPTFKLKRGPGRPRKEVSDIEIEHAEVKLRKDLAMAEKAELELEVRKGELLEAAEVKQGHLDRIARARAVLLGGPSTLASDLVGLEVPEIEARLQEWVYQSLNELATDGLQEDDGEA